MSVRQIAQLVGVSPATVSRAINNHPTVAPDVRKRVLAAVNRSGYISSVGKRSTTNIAFLYTGVRSLGSPYDAALMQGMSERMDEFGFDLMILPVQRAILPGESYTQLFHRKGIRGAVIRTDSRTRQVVEQIAAEGLPHVVVGDRFDDPAVSSIHCDSGSTSKEAVEHLLDLGHRRVGVCVNGVDDSDHLDRLNGYRAAIEGAGMEYDDRLVWREDARLDGGIQLARKIHALRDRPTALFIGDPLTAVGAINELGRLGVRVPDDISIVGVDDGELRFVTSPRMTAIVQDTTEVGRESFEVVHQMMQNRTAQMARGGSLETPRGERRVLPTRLELHNSTAAPQG